VSAAQLDVMVAIKAIPDLACKLLNSMGEMNGSVTCWEPENILPTGTASGFNPVCLLLFIMLN